MRTLMGMSIPMHSLGLIVSLSLVSCTSAEIDPSTAGGGASSSTAGMFSADAYMKPVYNPGNTGSNVTDMMVNSPVNSNSSVTDADLDRPDRFIPPAQQMMMPDAGQASAEEKLEECIRQMVGIVEGVYASDNCEMYTDEDKEDRSSGYNQTLGTAVCIKMECANDVPALETHNGIITRRKCAWLDDLIKVLQGGSEAAVAGDCQEPRFQIRVIPFDQWTGEESCDQYVCGLDANGNPIVGVAD